MIQRFTGVLLDTEEAGYVARALDLLAQLLAGQRSQPTPKLASVTAKLHKAAENASASGRTGSISGSLRATQHDSDNDADYATVGTGEAARILGCTPGNVRDLARRGRLTVTHTGTRWRFDAQAVIALAERRASKPR